MQDTLAFCVSSILFTTQFGRRVICRCLYGFSAVHVRACVVAAGRFNTCVACPPTNCLLSIIVVVPELHLVDDAIVDSPCPSYSTDRSAVSGRFLAPLPPFVYITSPSDSAVLASVVFLLYRPWYLLHKHFHPSSFSGTGSSSDLLPVPYCHCLLIFAKVSSATRLSNVFPTLTFFALSFPTKLAMPILRRKALVPFWRLLPPFNVFFSILIILYNHNSNSLILYLHRIFLWLSRLFDVC